MQGDWQATGEEDKARAKRTGLRRLPALFRAVGRDGIHEPDETRRSDRSRPATHLGRLVEEELAFGRGFLLIPVVVSVGAGWWFSLAESPAWWGLSLYLSAALAVAVRLRHRPGLGRAASATLALFLGGALLGQIESARLSTIMLDSPVTTHITGLVESVERTDTGWRYVVNVRATDDPVIRRPPERVTLVSRGNSSPVGVGHTITGLGRLSPPSGPVMPGLVDFGRLFYFDAIGAVGFFYGAPDDLGPTDTASLSARMALAIASTREAIARRIRGVLPGDTGAFANAIITGERRALSDPAIDALRNAGLAHVIAISGLHMALAAGIFFSSFRLLLALSQRAAEAVPVKKVAASGAIAAALFYLLISGMQVSARRAFIMLAVMLFAAIVDRPAISLRNVALAALVILVLTPSEVTGPGMQMSFAATLALMAGYRVWQRRQSVRPSGWRGPLRWLLVSAFGIVLTALIGGLSTTPFAIHHFSRVAGYGLLGNLLAMPVVALVVMPAGLLSMLAMPLNLHAPFLVVMGWGLDWVLAAAMWVNSLGGAFNTGMAPRGFLILFLVGFLPLVLLRTQLRLIGIAPIALSLLLLVWPRAPSAPRLLVSGDDDLVAIVDGSRISLNTTRPPSFVFDQWEAALVPEAKTLPVESDALEFSKDERFERMDDSQLSRSAAALTQTISAARATPGQFQCEDWGWCYAFYGRIRVMQVERPALTGLACDNADIVISRYRPGFQSCRSGAFLITPALRRQTGTLQFTLMSTEASASGQERHPSRDAKPVLRDPLRPPQSQKNADRDHAPGATSNPCIVTVAVEASVDNLTRPWSRHRLYSWREEAYVPVIPLPSTLRFNAYRHQTMPAADHENTQAPPKQGKNLNHNGLGRTSDSGGSARQACPEP